MELQTQNADSLTNDVNKQPEEVDYKTLFEKEQKRAKDNQAAFTKSRQEVSVLKKETQLLEEKLQGSIVLPVEQQEELEALKFDDPDDWYKKKQQYEQNVLQDLQAEKSKTREDALVAVQQQTQDDYMASWLAENTEITLDMIQLDVPQRIHKAYKEGTLTMDEYLEKSKDYLLSGKKKLASPDTNNIKDLNKIPGGKNPTQSAVQKQNEADSKLEIY